VLAGGPRYVLRTAIASCSLHTFSAHLRQHSGLLREAAQSCQVPPVPGVPIAGTRCHHRCGSSCQPFHKTELLAQKEAMLREHHLRTALAQPTLAVRSGKCSTESVQHSRKKSVGKTERITRHSCLQRQAMCCSHEFQLPDSRGKGLITMRKLGRSPSGNN